MGHSNELSIDRIRSGKKLGLHSSNTLAAAGWHLYTVTDQLSHASENLDVTDQLSVDA